MTSLCILALSLLLSDDVPADKQQSSAVRLVLSAESQYRRGRPLVVLAYLENAGSASIYVHPALTDTFQAGIVFEIFDDAGKPTGTLVSTHGGDRVSELPLSADQVKSTWILLQPRRIYGIRTVVPLIHSLEPGRYTLRATYIPGITRRLPHDQTTAVSSQVNVLAEKLVSEHVKIEILTSE
jgi:hypothetical protein